MDSGIGITIVFYGYSWVKIEVVILPVVKIAVDSLMRALIADVYI